MRSCGKLTLSNPTLINTLFLCVFCILDRPNVSLFESSTLYNKSFCQQIALANSFKSPIFISLYLNFSILIKRICQAVHNETLKLNCIALIS